MCLRQRTPVGADFVCHGDIGVAGRTCLMKDMGAAIQIGQGTLDVVTAIPNLMPLWFGRRTGGGGMFGTDKLSISFHNFSTFTLSACLQGGPVLAAQLKGLARFVHMHHVSYSHCVRVPCTVSCWVQRKVLQMIASMNYCRNCITEPLQQVCRKMATHVTVSNCNCKCKYRSTTNVYE